MVKAIIDISDRSNHILNIVKAKYNLNDKSEAIEKVVEEYALNLLEPELRPEFVEKINKIREKEPIKVDNLRKRYE